MNAKPHPLVLCAFCYNDISLETWVVGKDPEYACCTEECARNFETYTDKEKRVCPQIPESHRMTAIKPVVQKDLRNDPVDHPSHYTKTKYEAIDVIEAFFAGNYHLGNCFKYLARHSHKGKPVEDLKKARWYLDRYLTQLESEQGLKPN